MISQAKFDLSKVWIDSVLKLPCDFDDLLWERAVYNSGEVGTLPFEVNDVAVYIWSVSPQCAGSFLRVW
jgi:hypothetical protein